MGLLLYLELLKMLLSTEYIYIDFLILGSEIL